MVHHEVMNHYVLSRPCRRTNGGRERVVPVLGRNEKNEDSFYSFFRSCLTQSPPAPSPVNLNRPILATAIFLTERSEVTNMVEILAILYMLVRIIHEEI